jgi:hypothetical protein
MRHYPLMCTLALSLVVLCTSEAFLSSTTPFLPPRGGATRSTSSSSSSSSSTATINTQDGGIVTTATKTQRNLYMEDGLGGDETGGYNNVDGDYYNLGVSSLPINGKSQSQPLVKKNGTKAPPHNQIRLTNGATATTTTRMPPVSTRNGFTNNYSKTATTLDKKLASTIAAAAAVAPPTDMANGVVIQKAGVPFGRSSTTTGLDAFVDHPVPAEFVAETDLPTDVGKFRLRAYRTDPDPVNEFTGREPTVIYAPDKSPFFGKGTTSHQLQENVPIRIHDQCLTSEVFRSQR